MARFLHQAVASTRRQQPAVSEIIVLDSGTTAETPNIVRQLAAWRDAVPVFAQDERHRSATILPMIGDADFSR
jgi:glycosyltransferase involved in cell wall biosynthesis